MAPSSASPALTIFTCAGRVLETSWSRSPSSKNKKEEPRTKFQIPIRSWFLDFASWILLIGFLVLGSWFLVLGSWFLEFSHDWCQAIADRRCHRRTPGGHRNHGQIS